MKMGMFLRPALRQTQRLTTGQLLKLRMALIQRRRDLIEALQGDSYRPKATCPRCDYTLTEVEVLDGFLPVPDDITTRCPKCQHRFAATLLRGQVGISTIETPLYCPNQCQHLLPSARHLTPDELERQYPAVYRSVLYHWGSLRGAFQLAGIDYRLEPRPPWQQKVLPFLGQLPDPIIARACGVTPGSIRYLRRQLKVEGYKASDHVDY